MLLRIEKSCDQSHDYSTIKRPIFGHRTSSIFSELRTPSLVCPALSLSSFEVKLALPALVFGSRLRLWGTRGISLPKGASHFIVQETSTGSSSRRNSFSSKYKRLVRERCCPFTAQIWLVQIGRPLPDWYGQKADALLSHAVIFPENKRSLKRNAAWLDLLRTAPSRGRTA